LTSALDGGKWSASCPCRFTPRYPFDRRLDEAHIRSGRCGEEKHLALPEIIYKIPVGTHKKSRYHMEYIVMDGRIM
jgi:hypothetical protein